MSSLKYWVWLSSASGVGAVTAGHLLAHFGSPDKVFFANANEYSGVSGVTRNEIKQLMNKDLTITNEILKSCTVADCRILTLQDAEYPDRLRNTYDPPIILYVRGKLPAVDEEAAVAVVGTRNCTPYGIAAAEQIGYSLARHGLLVVTGLARGIDTAAALGALRGGGRVVAVIGSGVDVTYPPENASLFDNVARSGAILSEYPPGSPAVAGHFPARNRILSGLSLGVAVLEAPKKSGALITASRALEQGRDVFAMPGNVDAKFSEGANMLLREGAIPLLSAYDIVDEYAELFPDKIVKEVNAALPDHKAAGSFAYENRGAGRGDEKNDRSEERNHKADEERNHRADEERNHRADDDRNRNKDDGKKEIDNITGVEYIDLNIILGELSGDEKTVAETIGLSVLQVDEIIVRTGLPASQVLTALTMLGIKGLVQRSSGSYYALANNSKEVPNAKRKQ